MMTTRRKRRPLTVVRARRTTHGPTTTSRLDRDLTMGYGACSISGCPCKAFVQTYGSDLCNNCGHKYTDHW
jgi:hypothetical protein